MSNEFNIKISRSYNSNMRFNEIINKMKWVSKCGASKKASLFIWHVFVSVVLMFAVLFGVFIILGIFGRSGFIRIVIVIIFRFRLTLRVLRLLGVSVMCRWMIAKCERLEFSGSVGRLRRWLLTWIESFVAPGIKWRCIMWRWCIMGRCWMRWRNMRWWAVRRWNFMLVAMFIDIVWNWNNLYRFLLRRGYIKRFGIEFILWRRRQLLLVLMVVIGVGWTCWRWCGVLVAVDVTWIIEIRRRRLGVWRFFCCRGMIVMAMMRRLNWNLFLDNLHNGDWVWNRHWLLDCKSFRDFDDLRRNILLAN